MMEATREIAWNIPSRYIILMYVLFAISALIFLFSMYKKRQFIAGEKKFSDLFRDGLNLKGFLSTVLFQGKVTRSKLVGVFHGTIFYGFWALLIATLLVMVHYDTPFKIFTGKVYIIFSFLADIGGLVIILGILVAFFRRYIQRPEYLSETKPYLERRMYLLIIGLVISGFLVEGARIAGTGMPIGEKVWAPVGFLVAAILKNSLGEVDKFHRAMWIVHMVMTMYFIATIGYTKFFHIIIGPFNAFVTPKRRGVLIDPMNFEDEDAETFGLGKSSELTVKNRLDILSCVECGRCTLVCPANKADKLLNPKTIISKLRDRLVESIKKGDKDLLLWDENPLYTANELDACTTCGACMEECPQSIEHVKLIMEAKRYKVLTLAEIPPTAADAVTNIKNNENPWGIGKSERFNWARDLDIKIAKPGEKYDYLYYIGCAGAFDSEGQRVAKDFIEILNKAEVNYAVIGEDERCCGDVIRRFGDEYSFYEYMLETVEQLNSFDYKKIVVTCPHCMHTIGKDYSKFENGKFEVIHHSILLKELIESGKIKLQNSIDETITYHDPCYLGRHNDSYSEPRDVLKSINGIKIKEMEASRDRSLCCGMGGGNMWYELPEGQDPCENRLADIEKTGVNKVATSCFYCMTNFNSKKGDKVETENLKVEDIASFIKRSI